MHQIHWKMDTLQQAISARTTYAGGGLPPPLILPGSCSPVPLHYTYITFGKGGNSFNHVDIYIYIYIYIYKYTNKFKHA